MENKIVRNGTLTFGFTLILFGLCVFFQMFMQINMYRYIFMLWPLIFVFFGCEVLYNAFKKDVRIKYDIISIFLLFFIVFFGGIFSMIDYGLNQILTSDETRAMALNTFMSHEEYFSFEKGVKIINKTGKKIIPVVIEDREMDRTWVRSSITTKEVSMSEFVNIIRETPHIVGRYSQVDYDQEMIEISYLPEWVDEIKLLINTNNQNSVQIIEENVSK